MLLYIRQVLGTYVPLSGEGISTVNWEYIIAGIILIIVVNYTLKALYSLFK